MNTEQKLEAYLDHEYQDRINKAMREMLPSIHRQIDRDRPEVIIMPGDKFAQTLTGKDNPGEQ